MEYTVPESSTFDADYKGACALCEGPVHPGDKVVTILFEAMRMKVHRNVHVGCQKDFVESSPADMRADLIAAVVS